MKNILVTGSSGYIGTNLINYLPKNKYSIFGMDKIYGGTVEYLSEIHFDCHYIIHLAALPGIQSCEDNFKDAVRDNISSAYKVFDVAVKYHIPVIFISSQAAKDPKSSTYAMMKRMIEIHADTLNKDCNANIKVFRLTNVYGGINYLEKKNTVIKKFFTSYKNNDIIIIHGSGTQTRDFIHVDDICEFILRTIEDPSIKFKDPMDIGTGIETSIIDLATNYIGFDYERIIFDTSSRSVGVNTNFADTTKSEKLYKYKAKNRLQEYINEIKERNI